MNNSNHNKLAENYAVALFGVLDEMPQKIAVFNQLNDIYELINSNLEISKVFDSPLINKAHKLKLLDTITKHYVIDECLKRFLVLIIENAKTKLLAQIIIIYKQVLQRAQNLLPVSVISAHWLDEAQQAELKQYLEGLLKKDIIIKLTVMPRLIGGLIIKYDSYLIDCSIKGVLDKFKSLHKS